MPADTIKHLTPLGPFYTGRCFAVARRGAALPRGAVNWIQLTSIFTLAGGSLAARGKLDPWANLRRRCARFGTNPPGGEAVPCVKAPFRPLATVPLPLTNSALCKRSSSNGAARQRSAAACCSKTAPCVKAALASTMLTAESPSFLYSFLAPLLFSNSLFQ